MADGANESDLKDIKLHPIMSNKYKMYIQFNLVAYNSVI